jgi:hypothetical protein
MLFIGDIVFVGVYRFRVHCSEFTGSEFPDEIGVQGCFSSPKLH